MGDEEPYRGALWEVKFNPVANRTSLKLDIVVL